MQPKKFLFCSSSGNFELERDLLTNAISWEGNLLKYRQIGTTYGNTEFDLAFIKSGERSKISKLFDSLKLQDELRNEIEDRKLVAKAELMKELTDSNIDTELLALKDTSKNMQIEADRLYDEKREIDRKITKLKSQVKAIEEDHEFEVMEIWEKYLKELNVPHFIAGENLEELHLIARSINNLDRIREFFKEELSKCDKIYHKSLPTKKNGELNARGREYLNLRRQVKYSNNVESRIFQKTSTLLERILENQSYKAKTFFGTEGIFNSGNNNGVFVTRPDKFSELKTFIPWGDDLKTFKGGVLEKYGFMPSKKKDEGQFIQIRHRTIEDHVSSKENVVEAISDNQFILVKMESIVILILPYQYELKIKEKINNVDK